jgi:hypothetical protein
MVGWSVLRPADPAGRAGVGPRAPLDLHERQPDGGECVSHRGSIVTEALAEALDETGHGIDGEDRLLEVGRVGRQVDRRELVEAHDVVRDHDLGGHVRDAGPGLGHCLLGGLEGVALLVVEFAVELVVRPVVRPVVEGIRGFVAHPGYPTDHN